MIANSTHLIKRTFDIIFALLALVLLSPGLCLIALLIKIDSRGPVFYRGLRAGQYGKPFYINKFRTMILNAEKPGGDTTALRDPRITRAGAFLRRYKLDELPQLFNVIQGEMSIVGPRPELLFYVQRYNEAEKCILNVKPGITDLSSLVFHSLAEHVGAADPDHVFETQVLRTKNRLRIKYATERSFLLDLSIIGATARAIARLLWQDLKKRILTPALRVQLFTDRNAKR